MEYSDPNVVDSLGNVGQYASIAIDLKGRVHIPYVDYDNYLLKYANNTYGRWTIITLDTGVGISQTSIAVGSDDKVHIGYYGGSFDLKYATDKGGIWSTRTLESYLNVGSDCSIAIDSTNRVHFSFQVAGGPDPDLLPVP